MNENITTTTITNAVIYARFSDSKQREESIEGQLKVCHHYAAQHGYNVVGEYIDRAISGRTDERPRFQQMIRDSKYKGYTKVIVYSLDRFSRDRFDSAHYKHVLHGNDVKVVSATEPLSDGPDGILLESILEGFAEYYSRELAAKVRRGHSCNAEKCMSNGGTTPLGYRIENRHYVLDEESAVIVREIFEKYAAGHSAKQICDSLNERHLLSARKKPFNKNSLHTLLNNRKYLGIYRYNGVEIPGGMPQIIGQELFDKVAERLAENKSMPARSRAKAEYLLTGKLYCGYCKEKMVGHSSNQISRKGVIFNYYKCKNAGGGKPCHKKMAQKDKLEGIVIDECRKLLTASNIKKISKEIMKISRSLDDQSEIKRLTRVIDQLTHQRENQVRATRQCTDDALRLLFFEDMKVITEEIEAAHRQLELEKTRHRVMTEEEVTAFLQKLAKGNVNSFQYRKALIKTFVNKVFLYDDRFTIVFNTGADPVTITDQLLETIESAGETPALCFSDDEAHHKNRGSKPFLMVFYHGFFLKTAISTIFLPYFRGIIRLSTISGRGSLRK